MVIAPKDSLLSVMPYTPSPEYGITWIALPRYELVGAQLCPLGSPKLHPIASVRWLGILGQWPYRRVFP